jgi:hypothetical protein
MESIEEFMERFLVARSDLHKVELDLFVIFKSTYYTDSCWLGIARYDSLRAVLAQEEQVSEILQDGNQKLVVTSVRSGSESIRFRYVVGWHTDRWLIDSVAMECGVCFDQNDKTRCRICRGEGWLLIDKRMRQRTVSESESFRGPFWRFFPPGYR